MEANDAQLISLYAADRDAEAFAELTTRYRNMVYATCYRVLRNAADAEDAAQDCFVELARNSRSVRSSVSGWLHRVAVRTSSSVVRRKNSRRAREREAAALAETDRQEQDVLREQIQREVDRAIDALPDKLREPLVRHFLEGTPQTVLAEELGVSQPAVSQTIKRGIERLRRHLGRSGVVVSSAALINALEANAAHAAPATLVAALGKLALAGVQPAASTAAPAALSVASLAKVTFTGWQAKVACAAAIAVGSGVAVQQATRRAPRPPAVAASNPDANTQSVPQVNASAGPPVGTTTDPTRRTSTMNAPITGSRTTAALAAVAMAAQLAAAPAVAQGEDAKPARPDWHAMSREARRRYVAGEYEDALLLYRELVRVDVNNHAWILNCLIRLRRQRELLGYCIDNMQSISRAPAANGLALYQLRKLLDAPGLEAEAPRILAAVDKGGQLLKKTDPASAAEYLYAKGMMLRKRGDPGAAIKAFEEASAVLEDAPDAQAKISNSLRHPDAASRLAAAECHLELGDPVAAFKMVDAALGTRTLGRAHYFPNQHRNLLNQVRFAAEPAEFQAALRRGVIANAAYPWITETFHAFLVDSLLAEGQLDEALIEAKVLFWAYAPVEKQSVAVIANVLAAHDKTRELAPSFPAFGQYYTLGPDGLARTDDDLADPWAQVAAEEDSPRTKALDQALSQVDDDWPWRKHLYRGCLMRLADRPEEGLAETALSFAKARPGDFRYIGLAASLVSAMRQVGGDPRLDTKIDALLGTGTPPTAPAEGAVDEVPATAAPWQESHRRGMASLQAGKVESAIKELVVALALIQRDHPQMPGVAQSLSKAMGRYRKGPDDLQKKLQELRRIACPPAPK